MNATTIQGKTIAEIKTALNKSLADGFKPTLAIMFISSKQDKDGICALMESIDVSIWGCTTNGEFTHEEPESGSFAIMLLDIKKEHFRLYFEEYPERNYRQVARSIADRAKQEFSTPAFLIAGSDIQTDAEEFLKGFEESLGKDVNVFGGMAGDDYTFTEQFVFTNGKKSNIGIVCLALDEDKIMIKGRATCGWNAVGTVRTVTKSEGTHVYTVDDIPVLDITVKYGGLQNVNPDNENLVLDLASNFPLQLQREQGDPVMRPGLKVDWSDHSFYCSGTVPQGSKVRFSLPPNFDVMEKVIQNTQQLKDTEMPEADALVIFSCAGRIVALGPLMSKEIDGLKNIWNVPLIGMFSNAEMARATGGNLEMHNLTTCCVALKEK